MAGKSDPAGRFALSRHGERTLHYAGPKDNEHSKIGDGWNAEAERRFRAERKHVVERIERQRLVKQ